MTTRHRTTMLGSWRRTNLIGLPRMRTAMNGTVKTALMILGILSALLIATQLVMDQIILSGPPDVAKWVKTHQHSGYLRVVVSALYIIGSLATIAGIPRRNSP